MKKILILCCFVYMPFLSSAQKYITAGGVRFSNEGFGLTLQQKIFEHSTIEGIGLINFNEASFSLLFEQHNNLLFTKNLNTYAGIGPVFGTYLLKDSTYIGCNLIFGLEYKILLLPIVISADLKPSFKLQEEDWFHFGVGLSCRYIFIKEKRKVLFPWMHKK